MDIKDLAYELTQRIQRIVKPHLGKIASRASLGQAVGGDTTFAIDEIAEREVESYLKAQGNIAYYSEDKGLVIFGEPEYVLIVDPVDGSRPAAAGLESCCVSVAVATYKPKPLMKDVFYGCVQEIKNDTMFTAERGKGVRIERNGEEMEPTPSTNVDLATLFWTFGFRGRPADLLITVLGDLVNISSVNGGVFDIGSACFSITRLLTGQMDAYVDIGKRMIEEVPWVKREFERVGKGNILNNNPYDIAAATLIAQEAGCIITDGWGNPLDDHPLLGSGVEAQVSTIAASNTKLHEKLVTEIDKGIERLKKLSPK
ncbi:MAG: inositol monophosphatase family protein [Actinomycetota bacterium]|nr:inositol monophosphatase family protein [Actinomycetota bacterium]